MNEYFLKNVCILNAYKQVPASLIDELSCESKDIALLPSSKDYGLFTSNDLGNEYVCEGEVITIGRARYANIKYWKGSFISSNNIIIQSKDEKLVLTKYLYYYFLCNNKKVYIEKTTYPVFDKDHFNKLTIMIPSLQEQAAIVEKLDLISEAIECEEDRIQLYDELIKSKFVEMFGNPEDNNFAWEKRLLDDLCRVTSSKRVYQEELTIAGIPFLKVSDIVNKIDKNKCEPESYIPVQKYEELEKEGYVPKVGDILITARGTLGKCYIIDDDDKFYFQDGMVTWLTDISKDITPRYLVSLFALDGIKNQILKMKAGAAVNYLSIGMTKKLEIMLPPRELQLKFEQWFKKNEEAISVIEKNIKLYNELLISEMNNYFG